MAERALITGGAGFIGLHLARRLIADGWDVTLLDDFSRGRRDGELARVADRSELVPHDLTRPLPQSLLRGGYDSVYHLAAVVGVRRTTADPARVLRTNTLATTHLLDWCDRNPPGVVFLSSTSEVGDGAAELGIAELPTPEDAPFALTDPRRPRSSYALSKAVSEALLWHRSEHYRVRIGRYYNVYGPRMGASHVIPQFIERIQDGVDPFPLYGARQTRAFCYVDDAVRATVGLAALTGPEALVVNIGDDTEETEIAALAQRLFDLAGVAPRTVHHPPPAHSPDRRRPRLDTLRTLLPHLARTPLDTGLRETLRWYRAARGEAAGAGR